MRPFTHTTATALAVFTFACFVRADEKSPATLTLTPGGNSLVAVSGGTNTVTGGTLIESGTWLGLDADALSAAVAAQLPIDKGTGLLISHVVPESPAQSAGLEVNDVLLKFDDQLLVNPEQLRVLVHTKKGGDSVKLSYYRKGAAREATASLKVIAAGPDGRTVMFDRFIPVPAVESTGEERVRKALQDAVKKSGNQSATEPKTN